MTSDNMACRTVAVYGFKAKNSKPKVERAGLHYEVNSIRDKLLLGIDCSDILASSWSKISKSDSLNGFTVMISRNSSINNFENNSSENNSDDEFAFDKEDKAYEKYLKNLNPTLCKEQDHYKVLGLSKMRYKSTENQIKVAYKKKVLSHHPDKRRQKGQIVKSTEEDYFTCISKAYEMLSNPQKRRAFDSVDPLFDDAIPTGTLTYKENFFKLYGSAFERNERWSCSQPCPNFGDINSTADEVNRFYNFWYDFDSWREFSYLDEEDKEKGENRLERRWIDKQNKAARDKRRKDELKRIRTLVDSAYKNDPRVQKFKEDEKKRREEERVAKEEERRLKQEALEREKREEQEREEKERLRVEEALKQKQLNEKREKDLAKKALQKEKKSLKEFSQKYSYFCDASEESKILALTDEVEKMCQMFDVDKLRSMNDELRSVENVHHNKDAKKQLHSVFMKYLTDLNEFVEKERRQVLLTANAAKSLAINAEDVADTTCEWSPAENQLLIKAMTIFPVGTKSRWDVIATFINEHIKSDSNESSDQNSSDQTCYNKKKTGKDIVAKVKQVQKLDEKSKESVSKGMPLLQTKANVQVETAPSIRTDNPAESGWENNPWTAQEQKLLEQALKTYPADDPERWEKVAGCLPGRTKKDCIKRYKELSELVRARKIALQQQKLKQDSSAVKTGK